MAADPDERGWLVVRVQSPSEESSPWLAEGLIAFGATAVQEDAAWLVAWFRQPENPDDFEARVERDMRSRCADRAVRLEWRWSPDEDWSRTWRAGLAPRRIGRVVVTPSWCVPAPAADEVVVTLDPQMAFGTGEHASTRGVLRLLQAEDRTGDVVLDIGTGSAVLAISAALLGARSVIAVDQDGDALLNARENIERNGCADRVALHHASVDASWLDAHAGGFDLILANVLSGVLIPLLPSLRTAIRGDGSAILAGILVEEAAVVRTGASAAGFMVTAEDTEEEWWAATLEATGRG